MKVKEFFQATQGSRQLFLSGIDKAPMCGRDFWARHRMADEWEAEVSKVNLTARKAEQDGLWFDGVICEIVLAEDRPTAKTKPHTAADNLEFLRGVLEGRVPVPEGTVFNVNISTVDGQAVQLKQEADREPEPVKLGPGVEIDLNKPEKMEAMIKKIVREMLAAWQEVNAACCINISREEAAEIERAVREAGPGTIVPMDEAAVTGPCVVIDMPDGERIKLNSAAEAYKLAGCIEEMAGRVWPEAAKE